MLRCPGCGAPAHADAPHCDYCGSALATVTCPSCFAAMFRGSRFCNACGADARREVIDDGAPPLKCPRCRNDMQPLMLATIRATECAECGGLWLAPDVLQKLCDHHDVSSVVAGALAAREYTKAVPDAVRYIACPACEKLMNRVNFGHSSGVILDICKTHGVFLDRGELQRVISFVDRGGLATERKRQQESLAEEKRRLESLRTINVPAQVTFVSHGRAHRHHDGDVGIDSLFAAIAAHFTS